MKKFKQIGLLLSSNSYSFVDGGGKVISGVKVNILPVDNLNPQREDNKLGVEPVTETMPYEMERFITVAPAFYEFEYSPKTVKSTSNGKTFTSLVMKPVGLRFISDCADYLLENLTSDDAAEDFV